MAMPASEDSTVARRRWQRSAMGQACRCAQSRRPIAQASQSKASPSMLRSTSRSESRSAGTASWNPCPGADLTNPVRHIRLSAF